ncbi:hypothetical protein Syun_016758 [Stephania yunnanensis]|uniref:Clathrin light chain n=1 Tax=Stephania yunnanensis TaxID=152371 RepID=A0AAP0P574_9MAGN
MSSSFDDSFGPDADDSRSVPPTTRPFDDDGYVGYDPRLPSQRFDSFTNFTDTDSVKDSAEDSVPIYAADDAFPPHPLPETPSPNAAGHGGHHSPRRVSDWRRTETHSTIVLGGPMGRSCLLRRRCRRRRGSRLESGGGLLIWLNAIRLEEKEKREKELLNQIIDEADEYKIEFHQRRKSNVETNKNNNREKEKIFVAGQKKFHVEADKNYWKSIAELVPKEVPAIEKKRAKKDQEKKPSIVVIQGPKPGKPTDLLRMRQILLKLKHETPPHMKLSPAPAQEPAKDTKASSSAPAAVVAPPSTAAPAKAVPVA